MLRFELRQSAVFVCAVVGAALAADHFYQPVNDVMRAEARQADAPESTHQVSAGLLLAASGLNYFDGYEADARQRQAAGAAAQKPTSHQSYTKPPRERKEYYWLGPTHGSKADTEASREPLTRFDGKCVAGCYRMRHVRPAQAAHVHVERGVHRGIAAPSRDDRVLVLTRVESRTVHETRRQSAGRKAHKHEASRCRRSCKRAQARQVRQAHQGKASRRQARSAERWAQQQRQDRRRRTHRAAIHVKVDVQRYFDSYSAPTRRGGWGWAR